MNNRNAQTQNHQHSSILSFYSTARIICLHAHKLINMATKKISISLDAYENTLDFIRSLKPKTELTDNIEKAMLETRKAKLRKIEL